MPKNRLLSVLVLASLTTTPVWARQDPANPSPVTTPTPATAEPTEAEKALDAAIARIAALDSVSASLHQEGKLLGQSFVLTGKYAKASNDRVYLLLEIAELGDVSGRILQVSDGQVYWDLKQILQGAEVHKFNLPPIMEKLRSPDVDEEVRNRVIDGLGFGGPEALLKGLRKSIGFNQMSQETLDGRPVTVVRGFWKDYAALTSPDQPKLSPTTPVPAYVPNRAAIWLGTEDGWPYKVELYGQAPSILERQNTPRELSADGRPIGPVPSAADQPPPSEIRLVYTDVKINQPIGPEQFAFQPPEGLRVVDGTAELLQDLSRAIMQREAQRKAEAAKLGPELPSIPVPTPPTDLETPPKVESLPEPPKSE
jgi:outer membrane lipoprotein-sorting protein